VRYFNACSSVEEIKILYRKLIFDNHPDRCQFTGLSRDAATHIAQEINEQYQSALHARDGQTRTGDDGRERTYTYDQAVEQAIAEFIDRLIKSGVLDQGVNATLIGTWVWVTGETRLAKGTLKGLGCKWHSKRECWFWNCEEGRHFYSHKGLETLAAQYGARDIFSDKTEEKETSNPGAKSNRHKSRSARMSGRYLPVTA